MKPGQMRVLVLLIVLFALEAVVHPGIKQWLTGAINGLSTSLRGIPQATPDTIVNSKTVQGR